MSFKQENIKIDNKFNYQIILNVYLISQTHLFNINPIM
jgi:hypothetical protein